MEEEREQEEEKKEEESRRMELGKEGEVTDRKGIAAKSSVVVRCKW